MRTTRATPAERRADVIRRAAGRTITWQWQVRRCGQRACPCGSDDGKRHGPYLYAYWHDDGRLVSAYVGKW